MSSSKSKKIERGIKNDQFYTKPSVALTLSDFVKRQPWFNDIERVVEPSAGVGAFSGLFENCLAFDIEPRAENIVQADFLAIEVTKGPKTLAIGNPPFGRQSSLVIKFFKKCAEFADYIAFILPKSFEKASMQNRLPLTHSLIYSELLPSNSFHVDGMDYDVPSLFQIWNCSPRNKIEIKRDSAYFKWVSKEEGQVAVRRVGFRAGQVCVGEDYINTCPESHYYLMAERLPSVLACFQSIDWTKKSVFTAGPRSLSKSEIVELFDLTFPLWDG